MNRTELRDAFYEEIGTDLADLVTDDIVNRWLDEGQRKLAYRFEQTAALTWNAGDTELALPSNFLKFSQLRADTGVVIPSHFIHGTQIIFSDPDGADSDGTATLYYVARPAALADAVESDLPPEGDDALISFAQYRFYHRLLTSRSDYRRYSTLVGANAVGVDDLAVIAQSHLDQFREFDFVSPLASPQTFFED